MVEEAEFAEVDQLPELHMELNDWIKDNLGPKALQILLLIPLLCKRRLQRLSSLVSHLNRNNISYQEVEDQIQKTLNIEQNFLEYDGGLLKEEKEYYMDMHKSRKLLSHLDELRSSYELEFNLATARNERDPKTLLQRINEIAVTIGQLNSTVRDHALNLPPIIFTNGHWKNGLYSLDFALKKYDKILTLDSL